MNKELKKAFIDYLKSFQDNDSFKTPSDFDKFAEFAYWYAKANKKNGGFGYTNKIHDDLVNDFENKTGEYEKFVKSKEKAKEPKKKNKVEEAKESVKKETVKKRIDIFDLKLENDK